MLQTNSDSLITDALHPFLQDRAQRVKQVVLHGLGCAFRPSHGSHTSASHEAQHLKRPPASHHDPIIYAPRVRLTKAQLEPTA